MNPVERSLSPQALEQLVPRLAEAALSAQLTPKNAEAVLKPMLDASDVLESERAAILRRVSDVLAHNAGAAPMVLASALIAELTPDPAAQARLLHTALTKLVDAAAQQGSVEELLRREKPMRELAAAPQANVLDAAELAKGKSGKLSKAAIEKLAGGEVPLAEIAALGAQVIALGWKPADTWSALADAATKVLLSRHWYKGKLKLGDVGNFAHGAQANAADRPLATAIVEAMLDRVVRQGAEPLFFSPRDDNAKVPLEDGAFIPSSFWKPYLDRLAAETPPASAKGAELAEHLHQAQWHHWLPEQVVSLYLNRDPAIVASAERLTERWAQGTHLKGAGSLQGYAEDGASKLVPWGVFGGEPGGHIVRVDAAGKEALFASTGNWKPMALRMSKDELLMLSYNNDVAYLEAFDAKSGESKRRVTLPRPIHHLSTASVALSEGGRLVYASSDHGSRDLLVSLNPAFDPKDPKRAEHLEKDTALAPSGYKFRAVAIEGDYAYAALAHDGKNTIKLMRYHLPRLDQPEELVADAPYVGKAAWTKQLAIAGDRILVGGDRSVLAFEKKGGAVKPLGALPLEGVEDLRMRADGGADAVVRRQGEARLVELSAADVAATFKPF